MCGRCYVSLRSHMGVEPPQSDRSTVTVPATLAAGRCGVAHRTPSTAMPMPIRCRSRCPPGVTQPIRSRKALAAPALGGVGRAFGADTHVRNTAGLTVARPPTVSVRSGQAFLWSLSLRFLHWFAQTEGGSKVRFDPLPEVWAARGVRLCASSGRCRPRRRSPWRPGR